jgi:hypothetical protein
VSRAYKLHPTDQARLARTLRLGAAHPTIRAARPASLELDVPTILDQGQSSACGAHAASGSFATLQQRHGLPVVVPSPKLFYAGTRALMRADAVPSGALPALTDSGVENTSLIAALATFGAVAMQGPTPDGRNSDIWTPLDIEGIPNAPPANVNDEPNGAQIIAAAVDPLAGAYTIATDDIDTLAQSIASGVPVLTGGDVDQAFEDAGPSTIVQAPTASLGGHDLYLAGYRPSATVTGTTEFLVVNSWGSTWAANGTVWASEAWVRSRWDLWPMDLNVAGLAGLLRKAAA